MKKILLFSLSALLFITANAQTGVSINETGNSADASAMLDVSSTTTGMLIPRMTEVQRDAIGSPATGLMIYQTDGATGFYYYDSAAWVSATGAKELNDLTDGKTDYGNEESVYLGENAGAAATAGGFWDGKFNAVLGVDAFKTTIGGHESVAIGYKALELGASSTRNTAVGYLALQNNNGAGNTAIGSQSMTFATGQNNTALGNFSLGIVQAGNQNTVIGFNAGSDLVSGDKNIAIGIEANLANTTGNNQMNIGDLIYGTGVSDPTGNVAGNVGIGKGNNAPNSTLSVNGSMSLPIISLGPGGTHTLGENHYTVVGENVVIRLPLTGVIGRIYVIKSLITQVELLVNGLYLVDGSNADIIIAPGKYIKIQALTDTSWVIIGQN